MTLHETLVRQPIRHRLLRILHNHRAGGLIVADLTRELGMARSGPAAHVRALEAAGLIRKVRQSTGRVLVTLTPAGTAQLALLPGCDAGGER